MHPRRILVAVDLDAHATRAWSLGLILGRAYGAKVFVVHAVPGKDRLSDRELSALVDGLARASPGEGLPAEAVVVRPGLPAFKTILAAASELHADLLVLGGTGRTALAVMDRSSIPVWTISSGSRRQERGRARSSFEERLSLRHGGAAPG